MTRSILHTPVLAGIAFATSACEADRLELPENVGREANALAISTSAYGVYCSGTYSNGNWALQAPDNHNVHPCTLMPGAVVQRSGFWALNGWNTVLVRCGGENIVSHGNAVGPINATYAWARDRQNCIFTISPRAIPIFGWPFATNANDQTHTQGFDHAKGFNINVQAIGTGGFSQANIVDHTGLNHSPFLTLPGGPSTRFTVNEHEGHDWILDPGEPLYAVADGVVILTRRRVVPTCRCAGVSSDPDQLETYILHTITSPTLTGIKEQFVSLYVHMDSFDSNYPEGTTNKWISRGTELGKAGNTGCSNPAHLHFGVFRLTNTSNQRQQEISSPPTEVDLAAMTPIDPYGWDPTCGNHDDCFDPWSHRVLPQGAQNINLWDGSAPSTDSIVP